MSNLDELLDEYFSIGVKEGAEGRNHDDLQGSAEATRQKIKACFVGLAPVSATLADPIFLSSDPSLGPHVMGKAEAFDRIVAAQKAVIDAVAAYNARLEVVCAERNRGNWSVNVDPEYKAMSDAQSDFTRIVHTEACAALSAKEASDV